MIQNQVFTDYKAWHKTYYEGINFYAIPIKGRLEPFGYLDDKEVFVGGESHFKIKKKDVVKIPALTDDTDLNLYLKEYGGNCLFYALTHRGLGSCWNDLSWRSQYLDFTSMLQLGFDQWRSLMEDFHSLFNRIRELYRNRYGVKAVEHLGACYSRPFTPRLRHFISYPYRCKPHFDPIQDEQALRCTYVHCCLDGDFGQYIEEFKGNQVKLPVSVKDKMIFLFDEGVADSYETLMIRFGEQEYDPK